MVLGIIKPRHKLRVNVPPPHSHTHTLTHSHTHTLTHSHTHTLYTMVRAYTASPLPTRAESLHGREHTMVAMLVSKRNFLSRQKGMGGRRLVHPRGKFIVRGYNFTFVKWLVLVQIIKVSTFKTQNIIIKQT